MIKKEELAKKKVAELKEIAKEKKVKVPAKATKDDIIKLILGAEEVVKEVKKVKKTLNDNHSSPVKKTDAPKIQTKVQSQPQSQTQDFFRDVPELPANYGNDKLVLMVRDPFWGFAYWELSSNSSAKITDKNLILRMYDITDCGNAENAKTYYDIALNHDAGNWYIKFPEANRSFVADYGYKTEDGNFVTVIRSNAVTTPREDISDKVDEEWMMTDEQFKAILEASGANQMFEQIGSQEMVKFLSNNVESTKNVDLSASANTSALLSAISSSSLFGGSSANSASSGGFSK